MGSGDADPHTHIREHDTRDDRCLRRPRDRAYNRRGFSKLTRLNKEVGYRLDRLQKPRPIFEALAEKVGSTVEMHRTFNMGIGMAVILPEDRADTVINIAKKHNVEANIIGDITEKRGVWITDGKKEIDISIEV